jgi:hypothetical protein
LRIPGLLSLVLLVPFCTAPALDQRPLATSGQQQNSTGTQGPGTVVQLAAADIRLGSGTVLHLERFNATSISRVSEQGCKEDTIQIHSGRLSLTDAGLTQLINHHFEKHGDKKRIKVTADADKLKFEGSKKVGMSMTFEAKPAALGDSRVALVATDIKMEHLPVRGLMHAFGLNMDDLMHSSDHLLAVDKDNLILDLRYVSQRPHLAGRVTSVVVQGHRIILTFAPQSTPIARDVPPVRAAKLKAKRTSK